MSQPSKAKRTRWANAVAPHIPSAPDAPISVDALVGLTGLRPQDVHHGVGFLRDETIEAGGRPLVSTGAGYRYTFDEPEIADFRVRSTRRAHTTMSRLWHGVLRPYLASLPATSPESRQVSKQMERALEDLGDLLVGANGHA
jgi:hypothetical protein